MCRRSGDLPCSQSPAQAVFAFDFSYPVLKMSYILSTTPHGMLNLESKVLEKMCGAIGLVCFCPASSINPYTHSRCLRPRRVFSSDLASRLILTSRTSHSRTHSQTIGQGSAFGVDRLVDGSCQSSSEGLDGVERCTTSECLIDIKCQPPRGHGFYTGRTNL